MISLFRNTCVSIDRIQAKAHQRFMSRESQRQADFEKYYLRKSQLNEIKLKSGCVDCGFNKHPEALHFDHRDASTKLFPIGQSIKRTWESILKEIAKCDVRCANCHAIRHANTRMAVETVAERVC